MKIREIILHTHLINELKEFYTKTLELTLLKETGTGFTVRTGSSELSFEKSQSEDKPFYHFAFNIPENQLKNAKEWLTGKANHIKLITLDGEDEFNFESWNAHSIYFYDPAGNILEFIARHRLENKTENEFTSESILSISEIGIPVLQVKKFIDKLTKIFPLPLFSGDMTSLTALGDNNGLLIIVPKGRKWYPDCPKAEIYPMTIITISDMNEEINFEEISCKIKL